MWFATLDGAFGHLLPCSEKTYRRLLMLQNVLVTSIPHIAGLNPKHFRTLKQRSSSRHVFTNFEITNLRIFSTKYYVIFVLIFSNVQNWVGNAFFDQKGICLFVFQLTNALFFYGSKTILDRPNHFGRVPIVLERSNSFWLGLNYFGEVKIIKNCPEMSKFEPDQNDLDPTKTIWTIQISLDL